MSYFSPKLQIIKSFSLWFTKRKKRRKEKLPKEQIVKAKQKQAQRTKQAANKAKAWQAHKTKSQGSMARKQAYQNCQSQGNRLRTRQNMQRAKTNRTGNKSQAKTKSNSTMTKHAASSCRPINKANMQHHFKPNK